MKTYLKILAILILTTFILSIIGESFNEKSSDLITTIVYLPNLPGLVIYVIFTGDIHGWIPGPIGITGRIIVTTLGSAIFWSLIIYLIKKKRDKKRISEKQNGKLF